MKTRVRRYIEECKKDWNNLNGKPFFPLLYSASEKQENQNVLEKYAQALKSQEQKATIDKEAFGKIVKKEAGQFLKSTFGLNEEEIGTITNKDFAQSTNKFVQMARQFDSEIKIEDIFQASRNLWIINTIQMLMGKDANITPSLFAYSMLYPYTDNYLDDHTIDAKQKMNFSKNFRLRLAGCSVTPQNEHEERIYALVSLIENDWNRQQYPEVFSSLLAIQDAQTRSIGLLEKEKQLSEEKLMDICIDKGGTSVLADGYLINGVLSEEEERFMFLFGVWLQFVDDIQDVNDDMKENICTAFTYAAKNGNLSDFTNKSLQFFETVKKHTACFPNSSAKSNLVSIMQKSVSYLVLEAVATNQNFHTEKDLAQYETHSPLSFTFIRIKKSKGKGISIIKKLEAVMVNQKEINLI